MTDPIIPDRIAVQAMSPTMKETLIQVYRELADGNARLGLFDIAARCAINASALSFGGEITLMEDEPCSAS